MVQHSERHQRPGVGAVKLTSTERNERERAKLNSKRLECAIHKSIRDSSLKVEIREMNTVESL